MTRRGHTLLETVISTAAIAALALGAASLSLALRRSWSESTLRLDMDAEARRILGELRRELRQSGYALDGTPHIAVASPEQVTFRVRTGADDASGWSEEVSYRRVLDTPATFEGVAGSVPRYRVERVRGPLAAPLAVVEVARGVADLSFTLPAGGATVLVRLELLHPAPVWSSGAPPAPLRHVYQDQVEVLNRARVR